MKKFRAWSKDRNEYIPQDQIDQLFLRMDGRVFWHACDGFTENGTERYQILKEDVTDKIDIEFSTGRRDIKRTEEFPEGQEIYEGDKAKVNPPFMEQDRDKIYVIRYSDHSFDMASKTDEWPKRGDGYSYYAGNWNNLEIIGNIHEPEAAAAERDNSK